MSKIAVIWSAVTAAGAAAAAAVLVTTGVIDVDRLLDRLTTVPSVSEPSPSAPAERAGAAAPAETPAAAGTPAAASRTAGPTGAEPKAAGSKAAGPENEAAPRFDVVRVEPSGDAVVAGQSEPGAIVALLSDGKVVGKTVADKGGAWTIVLEKPLEPGDHDISAATMGPTGAPKATSEAHVAVSVPKDASEDLIVVMSTPGSATEVLQKPEPAPEPAQETVIAAAQPSSETPAAKPPAAPATATPEPAVAAGQAPPEPSSAKPSSAEPAQAAERPAVAAGPAEAEKGTEPAPKEPEIEHKVTVEAVETEDEKLYVAGAGTPRSSVRVYVDDAIAGAAKVDDNGRWLMEAPKRLDAGKYQVRADQVAGRDGTVVARAEVAFEREPDAVVLTPLTVAAGGGSGDSGSHTIRQVPSVIIRKGDNLWRISRRRYGRGIRYTTIYGANREQIRNPHLIYPGQVFVVPQGDVRWQTN